MLVGLDWAEPMMQFLLHVTCSCIPMHTYSFSIYLLYLNCLELYLIVSFFPFSLLFTLVVSMAPKYKSTPPQNLLCFGASSSSDPTPSHIWFRDEDARKDFSKNFSRRGVHLEHRVILSDFSNIDLPTVIHCQG